MSDRDWVTEAIGAAAFDQLASRLTGPELHSLLLEVLRCRAGGRTPAALLAQYRRDPFCAPAEADLRLSLEVDRDLLRAAEGFEAIDLSPVAPLGTTSVVGRTSQNRVLSALRGTEVVSDPTNVLALECARRLRAGAGEVHLTTAQRVLRAQPVPKLPGFAQHFRMFALGSGGHETKDHAFTVDTVVLHVQTVLRGLQLLEEHGFTFGRPRVEILSTPERRGLGDRIAQRLGTSRHTPLEHPYYSGGLRHQIWVTPRDGSELPLADGGTFDWLAKLAANRRAVFVGTGLGAQLVVLRFRAQPASRNGPPS